MEKKTFMLQVDLKTENGQIIHPENLSEEDNKEFLDNIRKLAMYIQQIVKENRDETGVSSISNACLEGIAAFGEENPDYPMGEILYQSAAQFFGQMLERKEREMKQFINTLLKEENFEGFLDTIIRPKEERDDS